MSRSLLGLIEAAIAHAEDSEDSRDGHVAAATAFLYRAQGAMQDKLASEEQPEGDDASEE